MVTELNPAGVEPATIYRTLVGTVVPRAIGWISTVDSDGNENIAPFSFFGVACVDPPMIHFTQGSRDGGQLKDTGNNIYETEEFVHNMVTRDLLESMHHSSKTFNQNTNEFERCGIEKRPSKTIKPPQVAASPVTVECTLHEALELGSHTLFIGEIQHINILDSALKNGKLDIDSIDPIGRLTAGRYVSIDSQIKLDSVKDEAFSDGDK
jgi:flavin reductase (DIM6/NTAB) family NADH-FMN oxidoreductase RutF